MSTVFEEVKVSVSKLLGEDKELTGGTLLQNLGLDSIQTIELIVDLETRFNIEISDDDLIFSNFQNIDQIVDMLRSKYKVT